jgi:hypothetical protein
MDFYSTSVVLLAEVLQSWENHGHDHHAALERRGSMYRRVSICLAALTLGWVAFSAGGRAGEPPLSGDRVATDKGDLIVHPYHCRSSDGTKPDFERLKKLVGTQSGIEIRVLDWYPGQ